MSKLKYPHLWDLFGAYMHQDWSYEGADWPDLVGNYVRGDPTVDPASVAVELDQLLVDFPDDWALRRQVYNEMGCCYDPRPDLGGPTLRGWLTQVADFLRKIK